MPLQRAEFMELPGVLSTVGSIKPGSGLKVLSDGSLTFNENEVLISVAGEPGVDVTPAGGQGDVTVTFTPPQGGVVNTGDRMFFFNLTAPVGWTKVTTYTESMIRVVSGTGGTSGGSTNFSTSFSSYTPGGRVSGLNVTGSVGSTTISTSTMAYHTHSIQLRECSPTGFEVKSGGNVARCGQTTGGAGGGSSHTHGFSGSVTAPLVGVATNQFAVKYADCILCSKN